MVALDNLVVTTALPVIRRDLGASLADLEWMVNAYTLTFAVLLLTGAALGDRFGRRRMFVIGLIIFTAGSAAAALSPTSDVLILARADPGRRRGLRHAAEPDDPLRRRAAGAPRGRARRLGRRRRPGHRDRPGRRRGHRRGRVLALDLLAQRPDRDRRRHLRRHPSDRVLRPGRRARPARSRPRQRRPAGPRLGRHPRQRLRLDRSPDRRGPRRRRRPDGRVPALGVADQGADAAAPVLPQPRLQRGQRRSRS